MTYDVVGDCTIWNTLDTRLEQGEQSNNNKIKIKRTSLIIMPAARLARRWAYFSTVLHPGWPSYVFMSIHMSM